MTSEVTESIDDGIHPCISQPAHLEPKLQTYINRDSSVSSVLSQTLDKVLTSLQLHP